MQTDLSILTHSPFSLLTARRSALITTYDLLHPQCIPMLGPPKSVPLVAAGHTRPVTHLSFSSLQNDGTYLLVSSCKDGNPMLREWTGDWIGTFLGHKGAVWSAKLSGDASRAATGSADFTAFVHPIPSHKAANSLNLLQKNLGYVLWRRAAFISPQSYCPHCLDIARLQTPFNRRAGKESTDI